MMPREVWMIAEGACYGVAAFCAPMAGFLAGDAPFTRRGIAAALISATGAAATALVAFISRTVANYRDQQKAEGK